MKSNARFPVLLVFILLLTACAQAAASPAPPADTAPAQDTAVPVADTPAPTDTDPNEPVTMPTGAEPGRTSGYAPQPGDALLERGNVFVEEFGILTLESYPPQFMLHLTGNLPTPCHELRAVVPEPGKDGRIHVELYSLTDPSMLCIQVLAPFEANIPLGSYSEGSYPVTINGDLQVGVIEP